MSVFSVSSSALRALLAAALLAAAVPAAHARRVSETTVTRDDGSVNKRIEINGRTVSVTETPADSDSSRHGITIQGDFNAGPVTVRGDGNGIVRLLSDARVGPGERLDGDIVAVFGSVRVEGEVTGSAVAVFGDLDLRPGAIVRGDAVAVGGQLREGDDTKVSGQTVQVGFLPLFTLGLPGLPVVLATIVLAWLVSLFVGWLGAMIAPTRLARVAITASRRTAASLALGIISGPLALIGTLLLLVTVVGIPLAVMMPLFFMGTLYAGQIAATYVLGCKLSRRQLGQGGVTMPLLSGSLLVASIFFLGAILWETPGLVRTFSVFLLLLGGLLVIGLTTIGTGAFLLSRAGSRPADYPGRRPEPSPPPMAATGDAGLAS